MAGNSVLQSALPDYEISKELGRGAMGIVYLGRHRALDRLVAIKELPPSFAADESVRERFLTEARVVASLDHPHVVVIHDFVDRDGHLAIVMEHLPNGTVWDQFLHHGLAAPRACGLVLATLAGLHHAHDRGIMHRDIKPENLIFTHDWQLKVTDFGIAQVLSGRETMATTDGSIVGTPAYMSPEQAEGKPCGPPADVYASGAMLYEMLTGSLPFPNATDAMSMATARLVEDPVPIHAVGPQLPGAIGDVAMQALARHESDRFASAEAFGVALAEAAADTWGPEWMSEAGTAVRGSEAIEQASRTTGGSTLKRNRAVDPDDRETAVGAPPTDDRETAVGASPTDDRETAVGASLTDDRETAVPKTPAGSFHETVAMADLQPIVPAQQTRVGVADLNELVPDDIVNVAEVRAPRSPLVPALLALAGLAAAVLLALVGLGSDPVATGPTVRVNGQATDSTSVLAEVDLTEPFAVEGLSGDSVQATILGIPVGSAPIESGMIDPGYLRYSAAGVVEFSDASGGEVSFPVRSTNSVYPTAPFVVALMVALGGLGSVQSNLRGMRSRRVRISPYIGLIISGAIAGAGGAVLAMLLLNAPFSQATVIATAGSAAFGSLALGEAYRRWRRRRRLKRVTVATGRRSLV